MSGHRRWELWLTDANLDRVAFLDTYNRLDLAIRNLDVGAWALDAPADTRTAYLRTPGAGIEVRSNGTTVFTGSVERWEETSTGGFTASGYDDMALLAFALAHPEPGSTSLPYDTNGYDVRSGPTSSVLRGYVDANIGPGAIAARRVPFVTLAADPAAGGTITARARYQELLDFLRKIALAKGLRFTMTGRVFTVTEVPTVEAVRFSEGIGNLLSWKWSNTAPGANHFTIGGAGELTARAIAEVADTASVAAWGRREGFYNRTDLDVTAELEEAGEGRLQESAGEAGVSIVGSDVEGRRWGIDYQLGDLVRVDLPSESIIAPVSEVGIQITTTDETITPGIGTVTPTRPLNSNRTALTTSAARLRALENG